jgi:phenylpropionate dioxygenase-like ring-hydroxylating dioxygenase large terminal subunit
VSSDVEAATAATNGRSQPGRALEPRLHLDPAVVEEEQRRIFERTWQLTGSGSCGKAIRCRYHGWTHRVDGSLIGVPEGRDIAELDESRLGRHQVRVEVFCGLVFVNLGPGASPLAEQLAGLQERLAPYRVPELRRFGKGSGGGTQPANWKIVVENYAEGYHIPISHPSLLRLLDYQRYTVEVHDNWVWFDGPMRDTPSDNRLERAYQRLVQPMPGLRPEDHRVWRFVVIYPNTTIDLYPDQVNTWRLWPDGPATTLDEWRTFGPPARRPPAAWPSASTTSSTRRSSRRTSTWWRTSSAGWRRATRSRRRSRSARRPWPGSRTASVPTWSGR